MAVRKLKILTFGDPALREKARPVTVFHSKIHSTIDSMRNTLDQRDDGAALAATQAGIMKRIVVIDYEDEYIELVNPDIISTEGEQTAFEGCLSLPGFVGKVKRFESVRVKYQDRSGNEKVIERNGNMARCLQHEIDHLDGILYIDRMTEEYLVHSETEKKISLQSVKDLADGNRPLKIMLQEEE